MTTRDLLTFLHDIEGLKIELRHSWLSDGRQESVAEHSWRICLMTLLLSPKLDNKIDVQKAIKMAIVHDLNEAFVGDVPAFLIEQNKKRNIKEGENILKLKKKYNSPSMDEICSLWQEYEASETNEAKFVKALDKLEVRVQHNEAKIDTWNQVEFSRSQFAADKYCEFDSFLSEFNELVKEESRQKIINESSKNIKEVLKEVDRL